MTPRIHDVLETDVVIAGAGVAGLTAGLDLRPRRVHLVTKTALGSGGSSPFAQGGMAAAVGPGDSPKLHAADTVAVAGGLADPTVVDLLTAEGPATVRKLLDLGVRFDRDSHDGLALAREAAHSRPRILHAHDATGAEIIRALSLAARKCESIEVFEETFACDLALANGRVQGVVSRDASGRVRLHLARAVIVATGGLGRAYWRTTNPREATGDGLAMAARAGVRLADLEFVQFHPTALDVGVDPMPLLTEALRGRGAVIVDDAGRRFLFDADPAGELAPRDVVARAIAARLALGQRVFLDARDAVGEAFPEAFPTVFALCARHGLDPRRDVLPVAPAAHYHMGGISVDGNGRTSLPGLWACGEVASTGAHGANRLASNSLLEAVVFGGRVARDVATVAADAPAPALSPAARQELAARAAPPDAELADAITCEVRQTMWRDVGLLRNEAGLKQAVARLSEAAARLGESLGEAANLALCGALIASAALERRESRGSHFREDAPAANPGWARRRVVTPPVGRWLRVADAVALLPIQYEEMLKAALREDLGGAGDLTTDAIVPDGARASGALVAREEGRVAGLDTAFHVFRLLDPDAASDVRFFDGSDVAGGTTLATVTCRARVLLTGERLALNILGRLCGIATATRGVVAQVAGTGAKVVCTRKTTPLLRSLEKYAVRVGGGSNHRFGLDDAVLVKDNHIAIAGSLAEVVRRVRASTGHMVKVEVEVDTLEQLREALELGVDAVLLDNMDLDTLRAAVGLCRGRALTEASGGITPATARAVAETGVDLLSLGWLTHSVKSLDVGLDVLV